jgi:hypothetical protein
MKPREFERAVSYSSRFHEYEPSPSYADTFGLTGRKNRGKVSLAKARPFLKPAGGAWATICIENEIGAAVEKRRYDLVNVCDALSAVRKISSKGSSGLSSRVAPPKALDWVLTTVAIGMTIPSTAPAPIWPKP